MVYVVRLASVLIMFQTVFGTLSSTFIDLERMEHSSLVLNIMSVVKVVFSLFFIIFSFGVIGMLMGHISVYVSASIAESLILLKHYRKLGVPSRDDFKSNLKIILCYGLPLYLPVLIILLSGQYRTIILAFFSSNIEIGNLMLPQNLHQP